MNQYESEQYFEHGRNAFVHEIDVVNLLARWQGHSFPQTPPSARPWHNPPPLHQSVLVGRAGFTPTPRSGPTRRPRIFTRSLLHPSCHCQRDHFSGSGSAQRLGATVHCGSCCKNIVQDHEPFALENLVVAHGERVSEVLHTRFGIEFRLGGRILHSSQIPLQHGHIDHLALSRRQVLRLIELPLSQLAWMQRHGNDGVDLPPVDPALRRTQQPVHQMPAEIHFAIVFES